MTEFKEIDPKKVLRVSEYLERPDGLGGTALVSFRGNKIASQSYKKGQDSYTKGPKMHVSLTREEHTSIKAR